MDLSGGSYNKVRDISRTQKDFMIEEDIAIMKAKPYKVPDMSSKVFIYTNLEDLP